jgi:hypothetical protein
MTLVFQLVRNWCMAALSLCSQPAFKRTVSTAWATDRSEPGSGFSLKNVSTMSACSRVRNFSVTALVRPVNRKPDLYLSLRRAKFSLKNSQARSLPSGFLAIAPMSRPLSCDLTSSDREKLRAFVNMGLLEKLANPALKIRICSSELAGQQFSCSPSFKF